MSIRVYLDRRAEYEQDKAAPVEERLTGDPERLTV